MEKAIQSLDLDNQIGMVTLTNGRELSIPKLSVSRLIKIIKFVGIDGAKLYNKIGHLLKDESMDEMDTLVAILDSLEEKQLVRIFSILLDMKDEEALALDVNEMLDVLIVYSEKVDFNRTFLQVRTLAKKMFKVELPETFGEWIQNLAPKPKQETKEYGTEVKKILQEQAKSGPTS